MSRTIIKIFGDDSKNFLQALVSNNIELCTENNPLYSCLLSPKGRYQFDFFIIKIENHFLIDISSKSVDNFINSLKYRKLIAKINFEILENYKLYNTNKKINDAIASFKDPRLEELGYRTIDNKSINKEYLINNYAEIRYQNVIPEGDDFEFDKSIPIEFGMDELNALNYNKGCYLGQEFTNSAKHRMEIRKRLIGISSKQPLNKNDIINTASNEEVGKIISNKSIQSNSGEYLSLALFKMRYKNETIYTGSQEIIKNIPNWVKIYSIE